jgi:hypothetical protein
VALNAVLQHVKTVIDGLAIPLQQKTLNAQVVPPPLEPLSGPMAWITPGSSRGGRQTSPRGPGFTEPRWIVDISLDLLSLPTDPNLEQIFPLAVDAVLYALWGTTMPDYIFDPTTGNKTQMLGIGEEYSFEPGNWVTTANGRALIFRGRITTTVREALQTGAYSTGGTVIP